jgi:hypothetical protein
MPSFTFTAFTTVALAATTTTALPCLNSTRPHNTSTALVPTGTSSSPPCLNSTAPHGSNITARSGLGDTYTYYSGAGTVAAGWPAQSSWSDFESMFTANQVVMSGSCSQFGTADNSTAETADIKSAIQSIASSSGIDERFILAIVLQESNGCVRAPTTD